MKSSVSRSVRRLTSMLVAFLAPVMLYAYDASVDRLLEGTLMCSGDVSSAALAFDDDASTYYSGYSDAFQWVGLDLGEPYVITRVGYTPIPGSEGADYMLLSIFEGANSPDFMDAVPLYFIGEKPANGSYTTADVNVSRGFRYVRYVGGTGSYGRIAELKFYGHAGEGDDTQFYQITNLPTLSVHVKNNVLPVNKGEDFESQSLLIYENGTMIQDYPILFRVRGNYSSTHENKAFRMKYNDGKGHHVMRGGSNESPAKCKKWVLINSYRDKTLMRNPVAWAISKRAERDWTPWSQVVDLVVNGDYRGTYTLADAVSIDKNRIDITEMGNADIDDETITGGYFIELDNYYSSEPNHFLSGKGNKLSIHEPDEEVLQPEQFDYIRNAWNNMEDIAYGSNYDEVSGLRSVLDMESFLKWFLVSEFNGNTDMICQVFKYKERGDDHFYTGPIWDADLALENDVNNYPANERMDWTYKVRCSTGNWTDFLNRVLAEPSVFQELRELWASLRKSGNFNPDDVAADVDSLREEVRASARLNFIRWPYLHQWLSLNPEVPGSWEEEVNRVRDYVRNRVEWMDYMLSYGMPKKNGVYQLASADDLCAFSHLVNESGETNAKGALVANINMATSEEEFLPIGTTSAVFVGSLDGQGHTISNLRINGGEAVGLFGHIGNCTLSGIIFDATCQVEGSNKVGMLAGYAHDDCATISCIENHGSVTATGNTAGALVGYGSEMAVINITNCSNTGAVTAQYNAAALVGPSAGSVVVANSYSSGTITGATEGKEFAYANKSTAINNCWDCTSTQTSNMTSAQVDNGYLCYQLNDKAGSVIWRQNLDNGKPHDAYPVLLKTSGRVYDEGDHYSNYSSSATMYRYYNLVVTQLQNYGDCIQFSEFDILDDAYQKIEGLYAYAGGPTGYPNENWENAADGDVLTKYCAQFSGYAYILFDAGNDVAPYGYRIYTANDTQSNQSRNLSSWKLYGSDVQLTDPDDPAWVLLDERTDDYTLPAANYTPTDFYFSEPIIIPDVPKSIALNKKTVTLLPGGEVQLQVNGTNVSVESLTLQWDSSNEAVATVDEQGHVVATGTGTAQITVTALEDNTLSDVCTVTVVANISGYRYYQLAVDAIGGDNCIQFSEFDLLDANGNEITPITTYAWTGTYIKDHDPGDLFDDEVTTKYCAEFNAGVPLYIYIDAGEPVAISGYRITTAADTKSYPQRNPITWSLFGSNTQSEVHDDDVWTLLDRRENDYTLGATNYTPYDFTLPQPVTKGDVNGDGKVDLSDAIMVTYYSLHVIPANFNEAAADMNGDGYIDLSDAIVIIYKSLGVMPN